MRRRLTGAGLVIVFALALVAFARLTVSGAGSGSSEWRAYGGDKTGAKYSPLDQINKDTVRNLTIAWRQSATPLEVREGRADAPVPVNYEHTPLMIDGLLYMSTGYGTVAALDAATGVVKWFDSPSPRATPPGGAASASAPPARGSANRSLAYWSDGKDARIIAITGTSLVALNAKSGSRYKTFGNDGVVDLSKEYRRATDGGYRWGGPPIVVRDVIVVGGFPGGAGDIVTEMAR